jgi:ribosomal protein S18 acetylase RimI-like enzyme
VITHDAARSGPGDERCRFARVRLRPAAPDDADRLAALVREAYGKYVERMGREPRPMTQDYAAAIRDLAVTVAETDGELAGMVALELDGEEGPVVVDNVAVAPAHQGTGVGRALLEHAEHEALRLGHREIALYTHATMTENLALYSRIGYVEYDRRAVDPGEVVYLRKSLA